MKTINLDKEDIVRESLQRMQENLSGDKLPLRQAVAQTCRTLYAFGHDSGLSGQISARAEKEGTYYTQRMGLGFDEITPRIF